MQLNSLHDLYVHQLQDLHSAEKQILRALPKMIKAANNADLEAALDHHREQTETHVDRLEKILKSLDKSVRGEKCKGMEGVLDEGAEMISFKGAPEVLDAGLIMAAQRVEHYEMAAYGCLRTYAKVLGDLASAQVLQTTLDEEADADRKMTQLAEFSINPSASKAGQPASPKLVPKERKTA